MTRRNPPRNPRHRSGTVRPPSTLPSRNPSPPTLAQTRPTFLNEGLTFFFFFFPLLLFLFRRHLARVIKRWRQSGVSHKRRLIAPRRRTLLEAALARSPRTLATLASPSTTRRSASTSSTRISGACETKVSTSEGGAALCVPKRVGSDIQ